MRTKGSKNVTGFGKRESIDTSSSKQVQHLANITGNPLTEFQGLLTHQENFLYWVDQRHDAIVALKEEVRTLRGLPKTKGPSGAKEATFVKYRWYAEELVLLEAINAFETFYKKTFIGLGELLQEYVQPEAMKSIKVEARLLWSITGDLSVPALVFEQSLFHDLDAIDSSSEMLIGKKRYNQNSPTNLLGERVRALRSIFQIRHTLSHNNGLVTDSDASKFKRLKYEVKAKEVIDPAKNQLGLAVFRELRDESREFTLWLATATAEFLLVCVTDRGLIVPSTRRTEFENLLGANPCWATVPWA